MGEIAEAFAGFLIGRRSVARPLYYRMHKSARDRANRKRKQKGRDSLTSHFHRLWLRNRWTNRHVSGDLFSGSLGRAHAEGAS
jgi:hypothetical protein